MINSYDNVLYTDYFIHSLIGKLRNERAILQNLSDHGEALVDGNLASCISIARHATSSEHGLDVGIL